jgi:CheY-like chemotaxis protein
MSRILIADDDAVLRALMHKTLAGEGHEVVSVEDGIDALSALSSSPFDLVISDLDMPGLDGMGLVARITSDVASRSVDAKILLISGLADELLRAKGFPRERVSTLQKPFSLEQFRDRVGMILRG